MATFHAPDGQQIGIAGAAVIRLRATYPNESTANSQTRIDWAQLSFVTENLKASADAVKPELASLREGSLPTGKPLWFNAKQATGPIRFVAATAPGTRSAMMLAGKRQFLSNTPEELYGVIKEAGGTPVEIPSGNLMGTLREIFSKMQESISAPVEDWD